MHIYASTGEVLSCCINKEAGLSLTLEVYVRFFWLLYVPRSAFLKTLDGEWHGAATPEANDLVTKLVEKFGKGEEELGQAQFAALLQEVLQDMADILSENPITVVRDAKLLNGSHLRKVCKSILFLRSCLDLLHVTCL